MSVTWRSAFVTPAKHPSPTPPASKSRCSKKKAETAPSKAAIEWQKLHKRRHGAVGLTSRRAALLAASADESGTANACQRAEIRWAIRSARGKVRKTRSAKCRAAIVSLITKSNFKVQFCKVFVLRFIPALLGWSEWSEWNVCNDDNERTRFRQCVVRNPGPKECLGNEREVRICNPSIESEKRVAAASLAIHWMFVIMAAFGIFCAVSAFFMAKFLVERRINRLRTIQGSPHYGAYPNQYSSLPTKDFVENNKPKRQSSFNGGSAGNSKVPNGTLTKSNNMMNQNTPKILKYQNDTDMSTLKRNSALNNMRLKQIEDDKDKY